MSATAFQRMRREAEARKLAEALEKKPEENKPLEPTNAELRAKLNALGIECDKRANKAALLELLEKAQSNPATSDDNKPDNKTVDQSEADNNKPDTGNINPDQKENPEANSDNDDEGAE